MQLALADTLRGVVAQVLLRKIGGGRLPAREVLLNTPAVAGVIAEGKTSQLPMAIEGGRRLGHGAAERRARSASCRAASSTSAKPTGRRPIAPGSSRCSSARASTPRSSSGWLKRLRRAYRSTNGFQLLQQKRPAHLPRSARRVRSPIDALGFVDAASAAAARVADDRRSAPLVSSDSSMKSSAGAIRHQPNAARGREHA